MDFAEPVPIKDMGTTLSGFDTVTTLSSAHTEEQFKIYKHILELVPDWQKLITCPADLSYSRLKGNSNACFRVSLKESILLPDESKIPRQLLYRRYEQTIIDKSVEQAIFKAKSEDLTGPMLYFQNDEYRIEEFWNGRPITLWEMRNPLIQETYAQQICMFNFNKLSNKYVSKVMPYQAKDLFIH